MSDSVRILLSRGKSTIIDRADVELVAAYKWHAHGRDGASVYARNNKMGRLQNFLMNPPAGMIVDHINGDPLDNRRANLRVCTRLENDLNRRAQRRKKCVFKGVFPAESTLNPWRAVISAEGKYRHLGCFPTEIEAAKAYDTAAKQFFGQFARLNFPEHNSASPDASNMHQEFPPCLSAPVTRLSA